MDVILYINSSGNDYANKVLSGGATFSCNPKDPLNVVTPTIYVNAGSTYAGYNYCYIPEFKRFYYAHCTGGTSQTLTFDCKSDGIMSFRDQLLQCPAVISRNPWHWDKYLPDPSLPVESRAVRSTFKFPNNHFDDTNNTFILLTVGPGKFTV